MSTAARRDPGPRRVTTRKPWRCSGCGASFPAGTACLTRTLACGDFKAGQYKTERVCAACESWYEWSL